MKKNIWGLIIFGCIFVIGIIILMNAVSIAQSTATSVYLLNASIGNNKLAGIILSIFGGLGVLISVSKKI